MLTAFFAGFLYALPLGPLGQVALISASKGEIKKSLAVVLAFSIVTMLVSALFLGGLGSVFLLNPALKFFVQLGGAIALIFIFLKVLKHRKEEEVEAAKKVKESGGFLLLFLLSAGYTLTNPMVIVFWINFTPFLLSVVKAKGIVDLLLVSLAFSLGSFSSGMFFSLLVSSLAGKKVSFRKFFRLAVPLIVVAAAGAVSYSLYVSFSEAFLHPHDNKGSLNILQQNSSRMIEGLLRGRNH